MVLLYNDFLKINRRGAKTAFQTKASAKQAQTFESCLSGGWKIKLPGGKSSHCPPQADWEERFLFFGRWNSEEAVLLQIQGREAAITFGKSASGAGRILGPLSDGSARTRDQSDLCKRHFWNGEETQRVRGGNTDVAALPIEHRACPWAIEATIFPTQR